MAVSVCAANADSIAVSPFEPIAPSGAKVEVIALQGVAAPSQSLLVTAGYSLTFESVADGQGVVRGALSGEYAVPVAGATSHGAAQYLTGDYGSALTSEVSQSGNYLSTGGPGTITITFTSKQYSLALLWGSIDSYNSVTLNDVTGGTSYTGTDVSAAANGFQGVGGSAYVILDSTEGFYQVKFTSDTPSFEFAGIAGSTIPFNVNTPEPSEMLLMGTIGIVIGFVALRLRQISKAAA